MGVIISGFVNAQEPLKNFALGKLIDSTLLHNYKQWMN